MKTRDILLLAVAASGIAMPLAAQDSDVDFNRDIRPILSANCFACHGPDEEARKAKLRLDTNVGSRRDLGGYRAVEPGNPQTSEMISRIESEDPDEVMPPPKHGSSLSQTERDLLRKWIAAGGDYQVHWAFVRPEKAPLPPLEQEGWATSPIDHFVLAKLEAAALPHSDEAGRATLIRRVSLDLTGLPPTPEEAETFIGDTGDDAFEKVVDRLLASDAFGEHWARMWLDLARYADTKGYEKDRHRDIWRFRDWVIDALNRDMPYDRFTVEQIAGDLLPDPTPDQILATAFHRNTMTNDEGGTDNEEFRVAAVKDRVDTTVQVWMGLTIGCAKCHSHKYDPITLTDYYSLYALFNQTQDADDEAPFRPTPTRKQTAEIAQLHDQIRQAKAKGEKGDPGEIAKIEKAVTQLQSKFPKTPVMLELAPGQRRTTRIHNRGNFLNQGEVVPSAIIGLFGEIPEEVLANRLGVARWLTQEENPLTARVMVNRIWARIFGTGLVETEEDFGTQGLVPTHPKLLDWLAVDFRERGWSIKNLLRQIVLSSTYRQSALITPLHLAKDPKNRLLGRAPRFRLSAETVRDQALAVSGLLARKIGGPSVMPPQPPGVWKSTYNGGDWKNATGSDRYRRALYTYLKRTSPHPAMTAFDAGSGEVCQIRRIRTNTPLQALVTLNDPAFLEAAGALTKRMEETPGDLPAKIARGFRLTLVRAPDDSEITRLTALYHSLKPDFDSDPEAAEDLLKSAGLAGGDAALVCVANVLLNCDETLTKP